MGYLSFTLNGYASHLPSIAELAPRSPTAISLPYADDHSTAYDHTLHDHFIADSPVSSYDDPCPRSPLSASSSSSSLFSFASSDDLDFDIDLDVEPGLDAACDPRVADSSWPLELELSPTLPPSPPLVPFSLTETLLPGPLAPSPSARTPGPPPAPRLPPRALLDLFPASPPAPYRHLGAREEFGLGLELADADDDACGGVVPMDGVEDGGCALLLGPFEVHWKSSESRLDTKDGPRETKRRRILLGR